jgi:uncharacterized protein (TIGR03086 family)
MTSGSTPAARSVFNRAGDADARTNRGTGDTTGQANDSGLDAAVERAHHRGMDSDETSKTDVVQLHARSVELFLGRVRSVPDDAWTGPTCCPPWDVRALVNHVVGEDRWTAPLMTGQTIAEVGDRLDGDLLGESPVQAAEDAGKEAVSAFSEPGAVGRTVHLSFGDTPAEEYAFQLLADHLIHGWDLAVATGGETWLDDELVDAVAGWYAAREDLYRQAGAVADRPAVEASSAQDKLLVAFGRDPSWTP